METIKGLANTASSYVYGSDNTTAQSGTEPLSGQKGAGTVTEPYDKGNTYDGTTGKSGDTPSSGTTGHSTNASSGHNPSAAQPTPRPEHETDKTGVTGIHSNDPHGSDVKPTERNDTVGDPQSAQKSTSKQQGADKPTDEPTAGAIEETKREKEAGEEALKHRDPNDHSGEPMKMHEEKSQAESTDRKKSVGQEGGGEHGKVKGTGEEWVKTSGLAAEGGDFDATLPGAGREANRILEQKGIHKDKGDTLGEHSDAFKDSGNGTTETSGEKKSLGTKLKEKMHIGSKKE